MHSEQDRTKFAASVDYSQRTVNFTVHRADTEDAEAVVSCVLNSPIGTARCSADLRLQGYWLTGLLAYIILFFLFTNNQFSLTDYLISSALTFVFPNSLLCFSFNILD